ncbi:hypothetical protein A2X44_04205 [candidate division CPR3 bacterium GWF2_35_18]|uniref:Uncharacterized protein n=1 Tax=candidate division CPR3 bacterium GW2011_GWF2_35_18 TaxID=1618350 RepID=A0A0G0E298_UNCC3|nr:MAG: hypothetical protein UR67_C0007G0030 [candidate division CPR3 bacterium GW2011_GWF2_35_18]KKP84866.1 MAG: hypothetical protein UR87_C0064G0001 [candidate division CPR3 bacterium GW2011_GWE2_35_7]OGB62558.1 MAG: hypothetical protein A2X44_04205 [candidate division CPR3 bacterium GWF2_35_18]OGB65809.1 MAG: hypothetical protein A2250_01455 [candidate division CPR3 bacterium RIFOXYA2_FULL_35_13]OGB76089.1 MAG: hypothetical protein A2476_04595 [candidate division CPR3 bacterium RIFOXYC2_FULL
MKNKTSIISSILWAVFFIGILEVMFILIENKDINNFFILSGLLCLTVIITSIRTYQPRIGYYHEIAPYLIHPLFLLIGLISFIIFNDNPYLRQIAIFSSLVGYLILFSENYSDLTHKAHDGVKFLIVFFLYDTVFESVHYFNTDLLMIPLFIGLISLFLFMHMFWRLKVLEDKYLVLGLLFSTLIGTISFLVIQYYLLSSYLIVSIILLTIYYVFWGILHHYIQKNLTLHTFFEYFLIAGIIISMFLGLITGW